MLTQNMSTKVKGSNIIKAVNFHIYVRHIVLKTHDCDPF